MKKLLLSILLLGTVSLNAQYCLFFDIKAENPEGSVIIQADKASQTGLLVEAMDQIRLAGVQEISIAAEND